MTDARDENYRTKIRDALSALVPMAWSERLSMCSDRRNPKIAEMFPTELEKKDMLEKICMADGLAAGAPSKSPGALAATAKALAVLSLTPCGVVFLGRRWRTCEAGGEYGKSKIFIVEGDEKDAIVLKTPTSEIVCQRCAPQGSVNFAVNNLAFACDRCGEMVQ